MQRERLCIRRKGSQGCDRVVIFRQCVEQRQMCRNAIERRREVAPALKLESLL